MLSLVERGESSPTAVVLEKVATGLGVPLATLFDEPARRRARCRAAPIAAVADPQSGYVVATSRRPTILRRSGSSRSCLPAGARVAYETGARDINRPSADLGAAREHRSDGRQGHASAREDDCLAMQLDEPTAFRNRTRKPARYIVVLAVMSASHGADGIGSR